MAARLVAEPVVGVFPPRLGAVEVHSPAAHRHAGQVLVARPGLVREAVVDDAVDAGGEHLVALAFDRVRGGAPASADHRVGGEGFGGGVAAAPHVRDSGGEPRVADTGHAMLSALGGRPKLGHGDVDVLTVLEVVRRTVSVRLDGAEQTVAVAKFREPSGVVLRKEVGHDAAEIFKETFGLFDAADDPPGKHREITDDGVSHALLEGLVEVLGPVLGVDLVAVHQNVVEAGLADFPRFDAKGVAKPGDILVEVVIHRLGGEFVHLKSAPLLRRGVVATPVADVTDAQYRPFADGDVPFERSVRFHPRRQLHHGILCHDRSGSGGFCVAVHLAALGEGLFREIAERGPGFRRGVGEHRDIFVEAVVFCGARQDAGKTGWPFGGGLGEHDTFHAVLRRVPRAAG